VKHQLNGSQQQASRETTYQIDEVNEKEDWKEERDEKENELGLKRKIEDENLKKSDEGDENDKEQGWGKRKERTKNKDGWRK
jgi:hypothetical protein